MFKIDNGNLIMEDYDLDHLISGIENGEKPKEVLRDELRLVGLNIKDVFSISLNGKQASNWEYAYVYSKIVCDF